MEQSFFQADRDIHAYKFSLRSIELDPRQKTTKWEFKAFPCPHASNRAFSSTLPSNGFLDANQDAV